MYKYFYFSRAGLDLEVGFVCGGEGECQRIKKTEYPTKYFI